MAELQAAQAIPWDFIQSLYTSGVKPKEISLQTGVKADTISGRASRRGWKALTAKVNEALEVTKTGRLEKTEEQLESLQKASSRIRNSLAASLDKLCEKLDAHEPKSLKQAIRLQADLEPTVRNSKVVCGWDAHGEEPMVRIALMAQCTLVSDKGRVTSDKVIDVVSVPILQNEPSYSESTPPVEGAKPLLGDGTTN